MAARPVRSHHRDLSQHLPPVGVRLHDEQRIPQVGVLVLRVGLRHHDGERGPVGAGGEPLLAVDDPLVTVQLGGGPELARVQRRHVALRHGETRTDLPFEQRLEPALLLFLRPVADQNFHVSAVGRRAIEDFRRHRGSAHDLAERGVFQIGQARAILAVGQKQVPQSGGAGLLLQLLHNRSGTPAPALLDLFDTGPFVRIDVLLHERAQSLLKFFHLFGVRKIHLRPLRPARVYHQASGHG